jgi:GINS complex subunit 2
VVSLRGVGAMEVCGERGFVVGVVGGLRVLGSSREGARREREGEDGGGGASGAGGRMRGFEEDEEEGMDF